MRAVFLKSSKKKRLNKRTVGKKGTRDKDRGNCEVLEIAGKDLKYKL